MNEVVEINRITVGVRRRDDLGDLDGLTESIRRCGLIHPIVVDETLTLVAGQRRLEASKRLGATHIEVRRMGELTEEERRELELEENLHRKDLTAAERSKTLVDLASAVKKRLSEDASAQTGQGPEASSSAGDEVRRPGPKPKPDSRDRVAQEMGVSQGALSEAEHHVSAMQRYPELEAPDLSRREALRLAEEWDAIHPQRKRTFARRAWAKAREAAAMAPKANATKAPKPKRARAKRRRQPPTYEVPVTRTWYYFTAGLQQVMHDFARDGGVAGLLPHWTPEGRARAVAQLQALIAQLQHVYAELTSPHVRPPSEADPPALRLVGHGGEDG